MKIFWMIILSFSAHASEKLALKTITEYSKNLKAELKQGLKKSPEKAIEICKMKAPEIQMRLSDRDIEIGRVSLKNRNPNNTPKEWMIPYINGFHRREIKRPYVTVDLDGKKRGLLKPIKTLPLCLKCHGPQIQAGVSKEIKRRYPNDKATGHRLGEIRGFFWATYER